MSTGLPLPDPLDGKPDAMPEPPSPSAPVSTLSGRARQLANLKRWAKGDPNNPAKWNPKAHRQFGSRNAATIYRESLPLKARQWVKSTNPAVLIDARKLAIPDADAQGTGPQVVIFVGAGDLPRVLAPVAADALVVADQQR